MYPGVNAIVGPIVSGGGPAIRRKTFVTDQERHGERCSTPPVEKVVKRRQDGANYASTCLEADQRDRPICYEIGRGVQGCRSGEPNSPIAAYRTADDHRAHGDGPMLHRPPLSTNSLSCYSSAPRDSCRFERTGGTPQLSARAWTDVRVVTYTNRRCTGSTFFIAHFPQPPG